MCVLILYLLCQVTVIAVPAPALVAPNLIQPQPLATITPPQPLIAINPSPHATVSTLSLTDSPPPLSYLYLPSSPSYVPTYQTHSPLADINLSPPRLMLACQSEYFSRCRNSAPRYRGVYYIGSRIPRVEMEREGARQRVENVLGRVVYNQLG